MCAATPISAKTRPVPSRPIGRRLPPRTQRRLKAPRTHASSSHRTISHTPHSPRHRHANGELCHVTPADRSRHETSSAPQLYAGGEMAADVAPYLATTIRHMETVPKLKRPFQLGILRGPSQTFKPIARIGLSADGGIMVMPVKVQEHGWVYGPLGEAPDLGTKELVLTSERPKLHYHRSGIVGITLSGKEIIRRTSKLTPLADIKRGTIITIAAARPWELQTARTGIQKGDVATLEPTWPQLLVVDLSILALPGDVESTAYMADFTPVGVLGDDPARFVVDMIAHGHRAILSGQFSSSYETWPQPLPGVSVLALSQDTPGHRRAHGLWSRSLRAPILASNLGATPLDVSSINRPSVNPVRQKTFDEAWKRIELLGEPSGWMRELANEPNSIFHRKPLG